MRHLSVVAIYAEDARDEVGGQTTIVGILPDVVELPAIPVLMPKLAVYLRIHVPIGQEPKGPVKVVLRGEAIDVELDLGGFDEELIAKSSNENPDVDKVYLGLILVAKSSPFKVARVGRLATFVTIDGVEYDAGGIHFRPHGD